MFSSTIYDTEFGACSTCFNSTNARLDPSTGTILYMLKRFPATTSISFGEGWGVAECLSSITHYPVQRISGLVWVPIIFEE